MKRNIVKRNIKAGTPSVGMWLSLPSLEVGEYVASLGLEWLVVDMEHNAIDIPTLSRMFGVIAPRNVAPMARIPWNTAENFKRTLDAGAQGVVVPMVNSAAEADLAVRAARFPPQGERSVGASMPAVRFGTTTEEYRERANDEILLIVQVEHIEGIEHVDEILSVPGIDVCFVGPSDLASSMGIDLRGKLENDDVQFNDAIATVLGACQRNGVVPGIFCSGAEGVNQRISEGFRFCAMANEVRYLLNGIRRDLSNLDYHNSATES